MHVRPKSLLFVLLLLALSLPAACAKKGGKDWVQLEPATGSDDPVLHITGTVEFVDLEGGVYVIRDAEETVYDPVNLPKAFRGDGMAVETEARPRPDMATTAMVGTVVELIRIRELPGGKAHSEAGGNRPAASGNAGPEPGGDATPDFRALGTEPGWILDIREGRDMHLSYPYGEQEFTVPVSEPKIDPETGVKTYHADTADHDFHVVIEPTPCVDGARGMTHEAAVTVTIDGRTLRGCGDSLHPTAGGKQR